MSISVDKMRSEISAVYPGPSWKTKVSHMPDYQVVAVYYKFLDDGKFDKKEVDKRRRQPHQLTFDEVFQ